MSEPDKNTILNELAELRRQNAELKAIVEKMGAEEINAETELLKLSRAVEQSPVSVIITDLDGNIQYTNPKVCAVTGYSKEELIGKNLRILSTGEKPKSDYKKLWETISSGKEWFGEFHNKKKNGELYWESASISAIFNDKHEIINYVAVKEDITERKKIIDDLKAAKEKAEENEKKFSIAFHSSPSVSLITNIDTGEILEANNAVEQVAGFSRAEAIGNSVFRLNSWMIEGARDRFIEILRRDKKALNFESTFRKKSGEAFIGLISGQLIEIKGQNCLLSIIHDITDLKRAENELIKAKEIAEENEKKFSMLLYACPEPLSVTSLEDGRFVIVNDALLKVFGIEKEEVINHTSIELNAWLSIEDRQRWANELVKNGSVRGVEFQLRTKKYGIRDFLISSDIIELDKKKCTLNFYIDITDRKNAETELLKAKEKVEESESKFKNLYEMLSISYLILKDGVCIECNEATLPIYGIGSKDEIIGKAPSSFSPEFQPNQKKSSEEAERHIQAAIEKGFHSFEWITMRKNKQEFYSQVSLKRFYYKNELYIQCLVADISERKKNEAELIAAKEKSAEKELFLSTLVNTLPDLVWLKDINGVYLKCNKRFEEFVGAPEHEIIGKTDYDLMNTDLAGFFRQKDIEAIEAGKSLINEEYITFANDKHSEYQETIKTPFYRDNQLVGVLGIGRNITERKNAELELMKAKEKVEESEIKFRQLAENLNDVVWLRRGDEIIYINPAFDEMFGIPREAFIENSKLLFKIMHPEDIQKYREALHAKEYIETGKFYCEYRIIKPQNDIRWIIVKSSPVIDSNGNQTAYWVGFAFDITKLKNIETELIAAKEKAEESDRLKSAFLANMSHEIRTPMNGILGFTDLLLDPDLNSEEKENYIKIVHKSGQRMLNTVNDIVEISKIEAGLVELRYEITDFNNRVEELVQFFTPEANRKGLKIILEKLLPEGNKNLYTDQNKLDSILTNLIKNAIKYTLDGTITIGCQIKGPDIEFYINDTGIGIPKHRQKAIFNRFEQADIKDTRVFEGSGLGLAISKSYVEMLSGKIWVESEEGKGSAFYFTLPVVNKTKEKPTNDDKILSDNNNAKSKTKKLKIVIAEDDEVSRKYLSLLVINFCREILEVETGYSTVEICKSNPDIDLILMDIQMPGMNGYEATQKIREFNKDVIIIAQTAFALGGDREKSIAAGCNDYISKPINKTKLQTLLQKYFG